MGILEIGENMDTNPLENILDQLAAILKRTEEEMQNPSDKPIPPDLMKQVAELERQVQLFEKMHYFLLNASNADQNKIKQIVKNPQPGALIKDRLVLDRLKQIKEEIDKFKDVFENAAREARKEGTDKKKKIMQRKKKFRGIGEGDKWKKM